MIDNLLKTDLHIHSGYSDDGELSVSEILARCRALAMELIAITDHNSVGAVPQLLAEAKGLRVLSGVELDCSFSGKNFHLLGYGFDPARKEFAEIEADILRQERDAAEQKVALFRRASGIPLDFDQVLGAAKGGVVTGELVAELALGREDAGRYPLLTPYLPGGEKSDMPYVRLYWDYFSEGKAAYVPIRYLSLPEAKDLIHSASGKAVLAHPGQNLGRDIALLTAITAEGIDGLEVYSSYHSADDRAYFLEFAQAHGLFPTCGSDFHGKTKPQIQIGGHGGN